MGLAARISTALKRGAQLIDRIGLLSQIDPPAALPKRPAGGSQASRIPITDRWNRVNHPGFGLNPRKIVDIYGLAELGWPQEQCDLFDDVQERDAHLRSQFLKRRDAVAGKDWILQPGGTRKVDILAAERLQQALRRVDNFGETLKHQLGANFYGYAGSEPTWDVVDGWIVPVWFANTPARRFRFTPEDQPMILTAENYVAGEPLEPGRWWFSRNEARNTVRSGLMRTATMLSYMKSLSLRDWLVLAERFGLPFVYGQFDESAGDDEKDELLKAVKMLGKDGAAIFSRLSEIKIEHAAGGRAEDIHGAIIKLVDDQISKLVTGSTLMSDNGGPGSHALGRVQENGAFSLIQSDESDLGRRFQQDIGAAFVRFNGLNAEAPRLKVHVVQESDPVTRVRVLQGLQAMGMPVSRVQMQEEFQVKDPISTEDEMKPPAPPKMPAGDTPSSSN